jgi:hypothetical protein
MTRVNKLTALASFEQYIRGSSAMKHRLLKRCLESLNSLYVVERRVAKHATSLTLATISFSSFPPPQIPHQPLQIFRPTLQFHFASQFVLVLLSFDYYFLF